MICFAMRPSPVLLRYRRGLLLFLLEQCGRRSGGRLLGVAFDDSQHVVLFHDEVLLPVNSDLLARVLAEENPIARFHIEGHPLAVVRFAVARGDDGALLRLLFGGVGDDDSADALFAFLEAVNDDAIVQRSDIHDCSTPAADCVLRNRAASRIPTSFVTATAKASASIVRGASGCVGFAARLSRLSRHSTNRE